MKHLKLSATELLRKKTIPIWKLKTTILFGIIYAIPIESFSQIGELLNEFEQSETDFESIADIVVRAIKTVGAVAIAVGGLAFLYLRDQQSDLTKKVGQVILGIALFWIILSAADLLRTS